MQPNNPAEGAGKSDRGDQVNTQDSRFTSFAGPSHQYGEHEQTVTPGFSRAPINASPGVDSSGVPWEPPPPYTATGFDQSDPRPNTAAIGAVPPPTARGSLTLVPSYRYEPMRYATSGPPAAPLRLQTVNILGGPFTPSPEQMTPGPAGAITAAARHLNRNPQPISSNHAQASSRADSGSPGHRPANSSLPSVRPSR